MSTLLTRDIVPFIQDDLIERMVFQGGPRQVGKTNWRVPTKNELKLLINCTNTTEMPNDTVACSSYTSPAIITSLFPNTPSDTYWSSSAFTNTTHAWFVYYLHGYAASDLKDGGRSLRCVSPPKKLFISSSNFVPGAWGNGSRRASRNGYHVQFQCHKPFTHWNLQSNGL